MVKILSQAGDSLADAYDVVGSVAGIDELDTQSLPIVHDMASTLFSERYVTAIRREASGDTIQNTQINLVTTNLPVTPCRLLGLAIISDSAARLSRIGVSVRNPDQDQELPIWAGDGSSSTIHMIDDGGGVVAFNLMGGEQVLLPSMCGGEGQGPDMVNEIVVRALTTGFGAGTVFLNILYYIGFAFRAGVQSRGVPFPSW